MSKINRIPKGLQELVGNTAQGVNPSELSQVVSPGVDIQPFWLVDKLLMQTGVAVCTTDGNGLVVTVPPGEQWIMRFMGARMTGMTVGDQVKLGLYVVAPGNVQQPVSGRNLGTFSSVTERGAAFYTFPDDFILPSDWQLWFLTDFLSIAQPSEDLTATWTYYKILV